MNPLESQLEYPLHDTLPETGSVHEIAPGVLWARMALPFALSHINVWLLEDEFSAPQGKTLGWTIIDCGVANDATRLAWESIFADHLKGRPVVRVIATHCHPDHMGLADWLCSTWNAPLWMTAGEFGFARMMSAALPGVDGTSALPHFKLHGLTDQSLLEQLQTRRNYYPSLVPRVPHAYCRLQEGQAVRIGKHEWQIITGFGHSPEHASLYCPALNILVSGDMVLPRISTNVSVFAVEPEANPVHLYLDSLEKFRALPEDLLVLPSHGKPFKGLHTRISQLSSHHAARLEEVRGACSTPQSAADIVPIMFRRELDAHQLTFALGEALAHLHYLWFAGIVRREVGPDSIIRFSLV
jgi:glyoxylase-like metal-dependent hydrolase (beta-lactamase superfamily II)